MKLTVNAEKLGNECVEELVKELAAQNIVATPELIKTEVFSEKKNEWITLDAKNVRFIFNK